MNRRRVVLGLIFSLLAPRRVQSQGAWGSGWTKIPSVSVVSQGQDDRLRLVHEAVGYWNRTFTEIGSKFRLGSVAQIAGAISEGELEILSATAVSRKGGSDLPESVRRVPPRKPRVTFR